MPSPDAGADSGSVDAGAPDAGIVGVRIAVHVVDHRGDLERAAVRAESATGASIESLTDAGGNASFDLDPALAPWSITAAKRDYTALSVLDVTGFDFAGDMQLDPHVTADFSSRFVASGTVTGARGYAAVCAFDAGCTFADASGAWSLDVGVRTVAPLPLQFVATDSVGPGSTFLNAVAGPERVRSDASATGNDLTLPALATPVARTRFVFDLPSTGPLGDGLGFDGASVGRVGPVDARARPVLREIGYAAGFTFSRPFEVTIEHFPGPFDVNHATIAYGVGPGPLDRQRLLVNISDFSADATITIPPLDELAVAPRPSVVTGDEVDFAMLQVVNRATDATVWRIIADARSGTASIPIPRLPSTIIRDDIGIEDGHGVVVRLVAMRMAYGVPWSMHAPLSPDELGRPEYRWLATSNFAGIMDGEI